MNTTDSAEFLDLEDDDWDDQLTPGARRILDVASELFYWRGIHAVGVDAIAEESGVTKRTLYDRYGSKDTLVAAYLSAREARWRAMIEARSELPGLGAVARVLVPFDVLPDWLEESARGCAFVNAIAELPDGESPGRQVATAQKEWLRDLFIRRLKSARRPRPVALASQLMSLHEGAIVCHATLRDVKAPMRAREAAAALLAD